MSATAALTTRDRCVAHRLAGSAVTMTALGGVVTGIEP